jgi:hypothetical protein
MAVYLGTATPSAYYLGSTAVSKLYLGSLQVWPVGGVTAKLVIERDNGSTESFDGDGLSFATAFFRAAEIYFDDSNGLSHYTWKVVASGTTTVNISFEYGDETDSGQVAYVERVRSGATTNVATSAPGGGTVTFTGSAQLDDVFNIYPSETSGSHMFHTVIVYAT